MQTLESLKAGHLAGSTRIKIAEELLHFPREIFDLADTLETLDLSGNQLNELPDDFGRLKRLKVLFLSQNQFTELPSVIADCPNLSMIGFKSNSIASVPENSFPVNTRWLILTDNKIESLPDSMGDLHKLQKLMLAGNRLTELPSSMQQCTHLELIRISANELTELPKWLTQLPKLSWLAFAGNPFVSHAPTELPTHKAADLEVYELLGEGASGHIHRASLLNAEEAVALKLFKGEVTSDGYPLDELHASANTGEHANIVHIFARYEEQEQLGLLMNLIPPSFSNLGLPPSFETCTRDTFAEDFHITANDIAHVAQQVASAMQHLHKRGISHGDLYSHNVLINDDAEVLLSDFGAASLYSSLPQTERHSLERLEVRALGCLIEDLLKVCDTSSQANHTYSMLIKLAEDCMDQTVDKRPHFENILASLTLANSEIANQALRNQLPPCSHQTS